MRYFKIVIKKHSFAVKWMWRGEMYGFVIYDSRPPLR